MTLGAKRISQLQRLELRAIEKPHGK